MLRPFSLSPSHKVTVTKLLPESGPQNPDDSGSDEYQFGQNQDPSLESLYISFVDPSSLPGDSELASLSVSEAETDSLADAECDHILKHLEDLPWLSAHRSGVLKDIFHVFHMIYISRSHGLCVMFTCALRDAIFLPDPEDKRRIEAYLSRLERPVTWEECLRSRPTFLKRHCKFVIPPPEILYAIVAKLFQIYGPLKDAQSGLPLFSVATWKVVKNILELIKSGYVSDPPGIPLYYCLGIHRINHLPI